MPGFLCAWRARVERPSIRSERIQAGEIVSRLPSLTELTSQTGLAVGTVRRAIDVLAREQLVRTVPGRGTFVIAARR